MGNTRENDLETQGKLLLRAREVSARTGYGLSTVYLMMANGELPTVRRGRSVRVNARALERWVESRTKAAQ